MLYDAVMAIKDGTVTAEQYVEVKNYIVAKLRAGGHRGSCDDLVSEVMEKILTGKRKWEKAFVFRQIGQEISNALKKGGKMARAVKYVKDVEEI